MAELLIIINPNASNREAGDVCVVKPDGWNWSELERKQFAVVRVPLTVEEAEAKYLKDGIPDKLKEDHLVAVQAFRNAPDKEKELFRPQMEATFIKNDDYPHRKFKLDVDQLPANVVQSAINTWSALLSVDAEAKAAARQEVENEIIKKNGTVTNIEKQLKTSQLLQVAERNEGDEAKDNLIMASRRGRLTVIRPVLDAIPTPEIVVLDQVELDNITIEKI